MSETFNTANLPVKTKDGERLRAEFFGGYFDGERRWVFPTAGAFPAGLVPDGVDNRSLYERTSFVAVCPEDGPAVIYCLRSLFPMLMKVKGGRVL